MNYSKQELLQCIYDTCTENLPSSWSSVDITFYLTNETTNAKFYYSTAQDNTPINYTPSNFIAPMNAAGILLNEFYDNSEHNCFIRFNIVKDGTMSINFE